MIKSSKNLILDIRSLQLDLNRIYAWSLAWLVDFNALKTKFLLASRRHIPTDVELYFNNVRIQQVNKHKHLGIIFNSKGTWDDHITEVIRKTSKRLHRFRQLKYRLDRKTLEIIYKSYIRPVLEYADVVWDNISNILVNELEKLQLNALRVITGLPRGTSHQLIYTETGIKPLINRRRAQRFSSK